jgi:hypothetical protein
MSMVMRAALIASVFATQNPVGKVVATLQGMQEQMAKEQKEDTEAFEKMQCWCTTNKEEKTAAVASAEKSIADLTAAIETDTAKIAELKMTLVKLGKSVAKNEEELDSASALRSKEAGEFSEEEKELSSSLGSVTSAVDAIAAQQSFAQDDTSLLQIKAGVRAALMRGTEHLSASQKSRLHEVLHQPAGFKSYNSRSGAIFGIMGQMKETFTTDLAGARSDEAQAASDYDALAAAKTSEIKAAKTMTVDKTAELSATEEDLANAKHDKELTIKRMEADQAFLVDLADRCAKSEAEYNTRSKDRQVEIAAVGEALKILSDDAARDNFQTTLSFAQTKTRVTQQARNRASALLLSAAKRSKSEALMEVATAARLDGFKEILGMVDSMVADLKEQMADEVKHQDFCAKELHKNVVSQNETKDTIEDLEATIADLEADIEILTEEIEKLLAEDAEMKVQVKKASEDRSAENKVFQQTVADQHVTQTLLAKALNKLNEVYSLPTEEAAPEAAAPSFLQLKAGQPKQSGYEKNAAGGGVLMLIQEIISEAQKMEAEATLGEQDAQEKYEAFVADTAKALEAGQRSIAKKQEEKAAKEEARLNSLADKKGNEKELASLVTYNQQLHKSCDYVMANFATRQEARSQEMDALGQAKAILSGA